MTVDRGRGRWVSPDGPDDEEYVGGRDLTRWDSRAGRWLVDRAASTLRWGAPRWMLLTSVVAGVLLAALMAAGTAELYESVVERDGVAGLDQPVLDAAVALRNPGLDTAVTAYTDIGGPVGMPVLAVLVTLGLTVAWRSWTPVALMTMTAAGSLAMTVAGKVAVGRVRPPLAEAVPPFESSASFPSGHSLNALVVAGIVTYLLVRKQRSAPARATTIALALLFAITMGLTRVYLGHHWLTDLLVAWSLGTGWLAPVVTGHRLVLTLRRRA